MHRALALPPRKGVNCGALATKDRLLSSEPPTRRIVRIRTMLDTVTVSTRAIVLRLEDGRILCGRASELPLETLRQLLGADVVVEGTLVLQPSGIALRVDVESMAVAKPGDGIWAMPLAESATVQPPEPGPDTEFDALFGKWPGDETDGELSEALRRTS
jgi:hypothetical protein